MEIWLITRGSSGQILLSPFCPQKAANKICSVSGALVAIIKLGRIFMNEIYTIIAALSALFAVILGPLVSLKIANGQSRVKTLSENRQAWINLLRDTLSEYISAMVHTSAHQAQAERDARETLECLKKLSELHTKIELMLNPNENDHLELMKVLDESSKLAWRDNVQDITQMPIISANLRVKIVELSQSILKREWERVKAIK